MTTIVADDATRLDVFWQFVYERRMTEIRRRRGAPPPWTEDPVILKYRMTNVYRASDRVSQYLIKYVQYDPEADDTPQEVAFRTLLFRLFNKIETYQALAAVLGEPPSLANWDPTYYGAVLSILLSQGHKVWNNAYMMTGTRGEEKHVSFLRLLNLMITDGVLASIVEYSRAPHLVYSLLTSYPLIASFLGMQYTTDLGYAAFTQWDENDFIVAGVGAVRGARKLFPDNQPEAVIAMLTDMQVGAFQSRGIVFPWLAGRRTLHKIDIQNCLCEWDKFTRIAKPQYNSRFDRSANPKPKQRYDQMAEHEPLPFEFYPPKWGLLSDAHVYGKGES